MRRTYHFFMFRAVPMQPEWWETEYLNELYDETQDNYAYDDLFMFWSRLDFIEYTEGLKAERGKNPPGYYDAHDYELHELE